MAHVEAPWGVRVEVTHGLADADQPFASPVVAGGFVTDGTGFGHVVFATTAFDASHRFVTEGLGLRQTDWLETEIAAGIELEIRFYHCNPRHHSLALVRAPFDLPQQLHHFMIEVADRDDVGYAFDRAWKRAAPSPAASANIPTIRCSASTSHRRPASRSRSATAPGW